MIRTSQNSRRGFQDKPPIGTVLRNDGHWSTQGLVGCWLFNERGGSTAHDLVLSPNANSNVKLNNIGFVKVANIIPSVVSGKKMAQHLASTYIATITLNTAATGVKIFTANSGSQGIGIEVSDGTNRVLKFTKDDSTTDTSHTTPTGIYTLGQSFTFAYMYNGTSTGADISFYLNGILVPPASTTNGGAKLSSTTNVVFGISTNAAVGIGHSAFVYNRTLSADEIKSLHENPYQMVQDRPNSTSILTRSLDPTKNAWRWT